MEKFPEQTIDIQKFDIESDAMFRNRTKKFDGGVLLNCLEIDKGLCLLLDSDVAEISRLKLDEAFKKLPRRGSDPAEIKQEFLRKKLLEDWLKGYM